MPQYSNSITQPSGIVVTSVLDTEANQITWTVTTPTGQTATATATASSSSNFTPENVPTGSLIAQLRAAGRTGGLSFGGSLSTTAQDVTFQARKAEIAATATNTPVPENPVPPPPVTNSDNPNPVPPGTEQIDQEIGPPLQTPPGTDEFDGLDTQVENNENGLQEPPNVDPNEDPFEASRLEAEERLNDTPEITEAEILAGSGGQGLTSPKLATTSGATNQDQNNFVAQEDWRIRLTLSPKADYLYKSKTPGILKPLADTNGVIFPYTPNISISYSANYDATELIHSNYKVYQYKNSNVDNINITCDFTAQDTYEANYLLAVIHFFRSVTKMFYGQDNGPKPGTPPPLCFLIGMGEFQFNDHPLAITSFNYSLPSDVDYIRAGHVSGLAGVNQQSSIRPVNTYDVSSVRLQGIKPGGSPLDPEFGSLSGYKANVTYVPTKMQIQLSAIPIVSRNDVSNNFSLNDYASGKLLRGVQNVRGGFW
jgi:hypothetical protein